MLFRNIRTDSWDTPTTTTTDAHLTPFFRTIWVSRHQNVSILDFLGAKDDDGGDNWSYKTKQSSSQIITTNVPSAKHFYRSDALPVTQSTMSRSWREDYHHCHYLLLSVWPVFSSGYQSRCTCPKDLQENLWGFLGWGEIFTGLMP